MSNIQKHLTLILLLCSISLMGQFKTVNGTFNQSSDDIKDVRITNPLGSRDQAVPRHANSSFNVKTLAGSQLTNIGNESILNVERNATGDIIAIGAKVNYNQRNITNTESKVNTFVNVIAKGLGMSFDQSNFIILSEEIDDLGMSHVKVKQQYKGLDIYGAESILHGMDEAYDFLNGKIYTDFEFSTEPVLEKLLSEDIAVGSVGKIYEAQNDKFGLFALEGIKSNLVIYLINNVKHLAYHHSFYSDLMTRWEIFIDANTGEILEKYQSICKFHNHKADHACDGHIHNTGSTHTSESKTTLIDGPQTANAIDLLGVSRTIDTYNVGSRDYLIDGSRDMFINSSNLPNEPEGAIWTIDAFNTSPQTDDFNYDHVTSDNNIWNDRASVSAQYNGAKAYLYFKNLHVRNSINGSGGNIISLINVSDEDGQSMGNAFWNGAAMFYGNGDASFRSLAGGLDVAGHEMTHGVVQSTANLTYQGESGALNESFADIFGAMIDRDDWLIGEDVVKTNAFPSGALRSLSDPHNGAATGDFGSGWQPKIYSERYTGSQDNGGVHINSGIPNYAFFLFANDTRLGSTENERKQKAEKVFYRALTQYLTKSSQFIDARIAVIKASQDLYGNSIAEAAGAAFDKVEVFGGNGGTYQNDAETNPGADLILCTDANNDKLYIFNTDGSDVANPLSNTRPISKPSVTDDGSLVVFVGSDKKIHYIEIDWSAGSADEEIFDISGTNQWRNAAVSKDGRLMAALTDAIDNNVVVFDLMVGSAVAYELTNPTYTTGISTGDVLYADALEFDYTGEFLMYDAENRINSTTVGSIEFWDIGFLKVWNRASETFALPNQIEKLFQGLPEGVSIGNATFSKNSNYIIAFDFIEDNDVSILGANIETGTVQLIYENSGLSYPSYSRTDEQVVFDNPNNNSFDLGVANLKDNKIEGDGNPFLFLEGYRWATWFSNGERPLSTINDANIISVGATLSPNPTDQEMLLNVNASNRQDTYLKIVSVDGNLVRNETLNLQPGSNEITILTSQLQAGAYILQSIVDNKLVSMKFIKL